MNDNTVFIPPSRRDMDSLMSSRGVHEAMSGAAQTAVSHAQSISPVVTGEYQGNFEVEPSTGSDWAEAHLVNTSGYAAAVEWGQGSDDGHHILSQTADWLEKGGG